MEASFDKFKGIKTYSRFNTTKLNNGNITVKSTGKRDPLTTKNAVKFLLEGSLRLKVCRYCLSVTSPLSELDEILVLAINGALHEVTIRDMVASFHPFKVSEDSNFPNKICKDCLNRTMGCYLFAQQCERAERALRNCFEDMYEKFEKLDPIEPIKKRGKPKLNPNSNILYTEHNEVIDYAEPIINIINTDSLTQDDTNIRELECQKCWQVLPTSELLLNHEKIHPKTMWYNCRLCGKSFVKRCHLRKHLKQSHITIETNNEIETYNITNFKCNDCGYNSTLLGNHLQHIEKHKFKDMFEHLIERNVEKLCAVCMDKGSGMVDLSEIIHLHGGYPSLSGDMTIQNMLTATIPGQKSYKYQELPIQKAKITLKKKNILINSHKDKCCNKKMFKFLRPNYTENTNSYIYKFSKPYLLNPFEGRAIKNDYNLIDMIIDDNDKNKIKNNLKIHKSALVGNNQFERNISYVYNDFKSFMIKNSDSLTTYNIDMVDENEKKSSKTVYQCKICWIFNKPNCKDCKTVSASDNIDFDNMIHESKHYNWIFTKSDKFDNRNTILQIPQNKIEIDIIINKENATLTIDDKYIWKCIICLSNNNKNKETCICCEKNRNITKYIIGTNISHIKYETDKTINEDGAVVLLKDDYEEKNNTLNETPMDIEFTSTVDERNDLSECNFGKQLDNIEEMEVTYDDTRFSHEFSNVISRNLNTFRQEFTFSLGAGHFYNRNVIKKRRKSTRNLSRKK